MKLMETERKCLISCDAHAWPLWAPDWLKDQVESPDCSGGTHPRLRWLAKWLVIFFSEHEGEAERWLCHAAGRCDRDVDAGEIDRLLTWANARFSAEKRAGETFSTKQSAVAQAAAAPDLEEIYRVAASGPRLEQYRASSPEHLDNTRCTDRLLRQWAFYAGESDPWVCFGSYNRFWTRRLSACAERLFRHEQIVPSPMRARRGLTAQGHVSEHSLAATGERTFLVIEFDFAPLTPIDWFSVSLTKV